MKLFWGSSYDRGLQHLLEMWTKIIEKYPDTELHICYGWDLFVNFYHDNPERMAWKNKLDKMMEQKGIKHHGRVGKAELKKIQQECDIWAYPTHFTEINCITALSCQANGCVPCVINLAALKETVGSGYKINGDIYDDETKERYLAALLELMGNKEQQEIERKKGIEFAKDYTWPKIANQWHDVIKA